jgi:hypothetical protein
MQTIGSKREESMENITAIYAVVTGIVIRLAIPIGITAVAIIFLRRLDNRWQAEAEEQLLLPVVEKEKCWEIKGCTAEMRASCAGYQSKEPCWQALREENGHLQERCLGCEIFKEAPLPITTYITT